MSKRIYIYVNGILTFPGLSRNWNRRAVTWTHVHTPHKAESLEYLIGPLTRPFMDGYRATKLRRKLAFYQEAFDIVLAGHSNGSDVILDALSQGGIKVAQVHLFSAACDADFERNCVNAMIKAGVIGRLDLYLAPNDPALLLAATPVGRALGYGALGRTGPVNLRRDAARHVFTHVEQGYGHSTWFDEANFDWTMQCISGHRARRGA